MNFSFALVSPRPLKPCVHRAIPPVLLVRDVRTGDLVPVVRAGDTAIGAGTGDPVPGTRTGDVVDARSSSTCLILGPGTGFWYEASRLIRS